MDNQNYVSVIVPLDNATRQLHELRHRYLKTPAVALPAHITLLSHVCSPDELTPDFIANMQTSLNAHTPFEVELKSFNRFELADVIYLSPSPALPFQNLAETISRATNVALNPDFIFHATVAHRPENFKVAEAAVLAEIVLPIADRVDRVEVYAKRVGVWKIEAAIPLRG